MNPVNIPFLSCFQILVRIRTAEKAKYHIVMYATHFGQFETNAELYFASDAMQTARNTANGSQNQNVDK